MMIRPGAIDKNDMHWSMRHKLKSMYLFSTCLLLYSVMNMVYSNINIRGNKQENLQKDIALDPEFNYFPAEELYHVSKRETTCFNAELKEEMYI